MGLSSLNAYSGGLFSLIYSAGPVAKAVMLILLIFSIISWTIMFVKFRQYGRTEREAERFFHAAREADSFKKLITINTESSPDNSFYRLIRASTKRSRKRQKENNPEIKQETIPIIENAMRITISEETTRLERRLSFLATTANASPFIGLFGTVWGIMDSFREIGVRGTTSLAVVAPGISEALIATAMGLAAAIPAVLAYNYFSGRLKRIMSRMENASLYLINLIGK